MEQNIFAKCRLCYVSQSSISLSCMKLDIVSKPLSLSYNSPPWHNNMKDAYVYLSVCPAVNKSQVYIFLEYILMMFLLVITRYVNHWNFHHRKNISKYLYLYNIYISWILWNLSFRYINSNGQFTPKMKANAEPRLLSSLVWIDSGIVVSQHRSESLFMK